MKKWIEDHVEVLGGAAIVIVLSAWVYVLDVLVHFIQKFW